MTATPSVFQAPAFLESDRLIIRGIEEADMADLLVMNQDDEVLRFLPYPKWQTVEDGVAWLGRVRKIEAAGTGVQLVLLERASRRAIGACVLFRYDEASRRAEIGFAMASAFWGMGLMTEALCGIITHAFGARGLRRLEAEANPANEASCRLLERIGFTAEGLLRKRWQSKGEPYDTRIFGLLREEWKPPASRAP
jgi:ribosomal-protein-alanine N-acetyltransferase